MDASFRAAKRGFLAALACSAAACLLSGCSSGLRADEDPPPGVDLSGQWQLAPGVREAERQTLDKAIGSQYARDRESRERWQPESQGPSDDPYSALQLAAPAPRLERIRMQLEEMALPAEHLKLEQGDDMLRFDYFDTKEPRRLRPGATLEMLFLEHDSANVLCGWSGPAFLIQTRAEELLTMQERFELLEGGQKLKYTVKLQGTLTGSVKLESIYERMN